MVLRRAARRPRRPHVRHARQSGTAPWSPVQLVRHPHARAAAAPVRLHGRQWQLCWQPPRARRRPRGMPGCGRAAATAFRRPRGYAACTRRISRRPGCRPPSASRCRGMLVRSSRRYPAGARHGHPRRRRAGPPDRGRDRGPRRRHPHRRRMPLVDRGTDPLRRRPPRRPALPGAMDDTAPAAGAFLATGRHAVEPPSGPAPAGARQPRWQSHAARDRQPHGNGAAARRGGGTGKRHEPFTRCPGLLTLAAAAPCVARRRRVSRRRAA